MAAMKINMVGHCTLCGEEIAKIVREFRGTGHPEVDGTPSAIGRFYPETRLVTLLLTDGSRMDISTCTPCSTLSSGRLKTVWQRICYSQGKILEPEWVRAKCITPPSDDQRYWIRKSLCKFVTNPPLGILAVQRWGDLYDGSSPGPDPR